jgi:hypothetical protein
VWSTTSIPEASIHVERSLHANAFTPFTIVSQVFWTIR